MNLVVYVYKSVFAQLLMKPYVIQTFLSIYIVVRYQMTDRPPYELTENDRWKLWYRQITLSI